MFSALSPQGLAFSLGFLTATHRYASWDMTAMAAANESALNKEAMATHISSIGFFLQATSKLLYVCHERVLTSSILCSTFGCLYHIRDRKSSCAFA